MDLGSFAIWISNVSETSELVPCMVFYIHSKWAIQYRIIGFYFTVSACLKIFTLVTAELGIHNMPVFHLLALFELLFLYSFYNRIVFSSNPKFLMIILLILLNVLNSVFVESIFQFNSFGWTLNTFILLCFGLRYLLKFYQEMDVIQVERNPLFIINCGFLIYFSGSLFTYVFGWKILSQEAQGFFHNAWIIQSFSNISKNVIVSFGLWIAARH
jgi:hypothetical protein